MSIPNNDINNGVFKPNKNLLNGKNNNIIAINSSNDQTIVTNINLNPKHDNCFDIKNFMLENEIKHTINNISSSYDLAIIAEVN